MAYESVASLAFRQFFIFLTFWRFPGVWRCARGGFRHAESESEVKNDGKQPPEVKKEENRNLKILYFFFYFFFLFFIFIFLGRRKASGGTSRCGTAD